jgi:hypothetical protein
MWGPAPIAQALAIHIYLDRSVMTPDYVALCIQVQIMNSHGCISQAVPLQLSPEWGGTVTGSIASCPLLP